MLRVCWRVFSIRIPEYIIVQTSHTHKHAHTHTHITHKKRRRKQEQELIASDQPQFFAGKKGRYIVQHLVSSAPWLATRRNTYAYGAPHQTAAAAVCIHTDGTKMKVGDATALSRPSRKHGLKPVTTTTCAEASEGRCRGGHKEKNLSCFDRKGYGGPKLPNHNHLQNTSSKSEKPATTSPPPKKNPKQTAIKNSQHQLKIASNKLKAPTTTTVKYHQHVLLILLPFHLHSCCFNLLMLLVSILKRKQLVTWCLVIQQMVQLKIVAVFLFVSHVMVHVVCLPLRDSLNYHYWSQLLFRGS